MAAYGLDIKNPSGALVLSTEGFLPSYAGRATLVSTTQPIGGLNPSPATGGFSTLVFPYAGQIIPVLALPAGYSGAIFSCTKSGSTWTMRVSYTDGTLASSNVSDSRFGMYVQATPTVFVYGLPATTLGAYGLAVFRADGTLSADLTNRPLFIKKRLTLPVNATTATVPVFTLPGIVGRATDVSITGGPTGAPADNLVRVLYRNAIFSVSGTTFSRTFDRRLLHNEGAGDTEAINRVDPLNLWLVECNGLP